MQELKNKLLETGIFIDNEYLDLYCELINNNRNTVKEKHRTQCHHIIPRCYFNIIGIDIDNSENNLVNLLLKDHVLAHCYLVLSSKENQFKYFNRVTLYRIINHFDYKDIKDLMNNLDEVQLAYESSCEIALKYNPMNVDKYRKEHAEKMRSENTRMAISNGMKKYRKEHPFTEEHRKKLSESAMGNHNWGNGDTRSIECYCILDNGERHDFHSYKDAGIWWYETFNPFNTKYAQVTFQRKIIASIEGKELYYGRGKDKIHITNIKWYRK